MWWHWLVFGIVALAVWGASISVVRNFQKRLCELRGCYWSKKGRIGYKQICVHAEVTAFLGVIGPFGMMMVVPYGLIQGVYKLPVGGNRWLIRKTEKGRLKHQLAMENLAQQQEQADAEAKLARTRRQTAELEDRAQALADNVRHLQHYYE